MRITTAVTSNLQIFQVLIQKRIFSMTMNAVWIQTFQIFFACRIMIFNKRQVASPVAIRTKDFSVPLRILFRISVQSH
jgi:hypothetical protein